jgi:hypothetical protein
MGDQICASTVVDLGDELPRVCRLCQRPSRNGNTAFGTESLFLVARPRHLHQDVGRIVTPR